MTSKSLTEEEKETSSGALPAPLVNTVKWVGLPLSIPAQERVCNSQARIHTDMDHFIEL